MEGGKPQETLEYREQTEGGWGGGGEGKVEEGTCWDEHWVLHVSQFDNELYFKMCLSLFFTLSTK